MKHNHLSRGRKSKQDEYYTLLEDIGLEIVKYIHQLRGKVVYCNCDDEWSAFVYFFITYFHIFDLKRLYCTGIGCKLIEYDGCRMKKRKINGDFRSAECREILAKCDIVITNPPFSLFREWLEVIGGKDFLVIGNKNAVSFEVFFPMIQCGRVKLGYTIPKKFYTPDGSITNNVNGLCRWFTTLEVVKKPVFRPTCLYEEGNYKMYDHYPAIEVGEVKKIPSDYNGLIGVPITYFDKIDYNSYELIDRISRYSVMDKSIGIKGHQLTEIDGKPKYSRLIIKKR